jgi:hypothetical protein
MIRDLRAGDPREVGSYRLLGRLGIGGMGQVYLARSPGGRLVALKVIRPELADEPGFRARFAREVAAARQVSGVLTAAVMDADPDAETPWMATAYVQGPSLAEAVEGYGPLPERSALALALGLAEALHAIHAAGVVHRDLKPSNVLLAGDGPRVIDFGISRAMERSMLTTSGTVMGSPGFLSPEQAEGRPAGRPTDVFSLGAVLTYAAAGHGPFGSGQASALLYRVVNQAPDLSGVPSRLRPAVERCLAKDPLARPALADLLAEFGVEAGILADGWLPAELTGTFDRYIPDGQAVPDAAEVAAGVPAEVPDIVPGEVPDGADSTRLPRVATSPAEPAGQAGAGQAMAAHGTEVTADPSAMDTQSLSGRGAAGPAEAGAGLGRGAGAVDAGAVDAGARQPGVAEPGAARPAREGVSAAAVLPGRRPRKRLTLMAGISAVAIAAVLIPALVLAPGATPKTVGSPTVPPVALLTHGGTSSGAPSRTAASAVTSASRTSATATTRHPATRRATARRTRPAPTVTTLPPPASTASSQPATTPATHATTAPSHTTASPTHSTPKPTHTTSAPKPGPQKITSATGVEWEACSAYGQAATSPGGAAASYTFTNDSSANVGIWYINSSRVGTPTATVSPGNSYSPKTNNGDVWMVMNSSGSCIEIFGFDSFSGTIVIGS